MELMEKLNSELVKQNPLMPVKYEGINIGIYKVKEVMFALYLLVNEMKDDLKDGFQFTDFFSMAKFLLSDKDFKLAIGDGFEVILHLDKYWGEFKVKEIIELYQYARLLFSVLKK